MSETFKHRIIRLIVILLFQILICNNMHVFGYASPIVLVYMTMKFHRGASRESILIWGFVLGLIFDIFSNTMGKGMAVCTLLAMMQPFLMRMFSPNESVDMLVPSFKSMGLDRYLYYAFVNLFIFHLCFYFLEDFSLQHFKLMITGTFAGTITAFVFVIIADVLIPKDANID